MANTASGERAFETTIRLHLIEFRRDWGRGAAPVACRRVSGIFFTGIKEGGLWRWLFLVGIELGAGLGAHLFPTLNIVTRPNPGFWILVSYGLLVGWGTRQGGGCTSGHGVCGLGRPAPRSLVAVMVFMAAGIFMASLLRHWLGVLA